MTKIAEAWGGFQDAIRKFHEASVFQAEEWATRRMAVDEAARALALAVYEETMDTVIDASLRGGGDRYAEAVREEINKLGEKAND